MTSYLDTKKKRKYSIGVLRGLSTAQAAKEIGVTTRTLFRWLELGLLPEPRRVKMPAYDWRIWSAQDIERAKRVKKTIKRGRPKKRNK